MFKYYFWWCLEIIRLFFTDFLLYNEKGQISGMSFKTCVPPFDHSHFTTRANANNIKQQPSKVEYVDLWTEEDVFSALEKVSVSE